MAFNRTVIISSVLVNNNLIIPNSPSVNASEASPAWLKDMPASHVGIAGSNPALRMCLSRSYGCRFAKLLLVFAKLLLPGDSKACPITSLENSLLNSVINFPLIMKTSRLESIMSWSSCNVVENGVSTMLGI